jgi:type I restriction enzyme S subunit
LSLSNDSDSDTGVINPLSISIRSTWLFQEELRLDADYYAKEQYLARKLLEDSGYKTKPLKEVLSCPPYWPPRFKRVYTTDMDQGLPFLSPKETLEFRKKSRRYLSKIKTKDLDKLMVKEDWLLMTRSGTVGKIVMSNGNLTRYAISDDMIRIIPNNISVPDGYLFAFLSTWLAQSLISKDQYGQNVNHIEPFQIENIPIPLLNPELISLFEEQIKIVNTIRQLANQKLDYAEKKFSEYTGLVKEVVDPILTKKSFSLHYSEIKSRLDASFYNPLIRNTINELKKSNMIKIVKAEILGNIIVANRFKRIYVEKDHGIPFLQGSDLPLIRPYSLKYISKKMTKNINHWVIYQNWILVTCSGTIGKIGLTTPITDKWAASQHILRFIPNEYVTEAIGYKVESGYIAFYLTTDYGYNQIIGKTYGSVVDEIYDKDIGDVFIALPKDKTIHDQISSLTKKAFMLKDFAFIVERETIKLLENILTGSIKIENPDKAKEIILQETGFKEKFTSLDELYKYMKEITSSPS